MTDYKTLRVPEDAYETAVESKKDDETWGEFLQRCSENPPEIIEYVDASVVDGASNGDGGTNITVENVEVPVENAQEGSDLSTEDVEAIVESWMERNADRLRKGEI